MSWFGAHWPWITAAGTAIGGILGWLVHLWRSKEEIAKIREEREQMREERRQMEYRLNVQSCAEHIHMMANVVKGQQGSHDVLFSEDEIYEWAREANWGQYAHAALQLLREKGLAELSTEPNHYYIDRPKF